MFEQYFREIRVYSYLYTPTQAVFAQSFICNVLSYAAIRCEASAAPGFEALTREPERPLVRTQDVPGPKGLELYKKYEKYQVRMSEFTILIYMITYVSYTISFEVPLISVHVLVM